MSESQGSEVLTSAQAMGLCLHRHGHHFFTAQARGTLAERAKNVFTI